MNTYYVYYMVLNIRTGDTVRITDEKIMKAESMDALRKKLAKAVIDLSSKRYDYTACVSKVRGHSKSDNPMGGDVIRIYADDGSIIAGWEPYGDKARDKGIYYEIDMKTGKLGKKKSWWNRWHPR